MRLPTPIPNAIFYHHVNHWLDVVKKKESVSVIGLTSREQPYRINQLINGKEIWKDNNLDITKINIIQINLEATTIEEGEELNEYLHKNIKKEKATIIGIIVKMCGVFDDNGTLNKSTI